MFFLKKIILILCTFYLALPAFADELTPNERILRQEILYTAGSNYIDKTYYAGSKILRWNKAYFPIKIYIEKSSKVPNYYTYAFIKAVAVWQKELKGVLNFALAIDENEADIAFKVIDKKELIRKTKINETQILAYTEPVIKNDKLLKMNIFIYEKTLDGEYFKPYEILNIAIHEFGHALGISGHSDDPSSIMYALYSPETEKKSGFINRQDKNTVSILYKIAPDITNGDKTKETGNLPAKIILGSYDERINTSIEKQLEELKIKTGDSLSRVQLAALYQQKNDYSNMLKYIKEAQTFAKTDMELFSVHVAYASYYYSKKNKQNALLYVNKALEYKDDKAIRQLKEHILRLK